MKSLYILGLIVLVFFVSACTVQDTTTKTTDSEVITTSTENIDTQPEPADTKPVILMSKEEKLAQAAKDAGYRGIALAGKESLYLEYNKADYDKAIAADKLILLNFYTEEYERSVEEDPYAKDAFDELDNERIVGFRVHYRDDAVTTDDEAIALKHGVADRNTKVIIKYGERVFKNSERWDEQRYIDELTRNLG